MFLTETRTDSDSICISNLCTKGCRVIEQVRPRLHVNTSLTTYGGVAPVVVPGVRLTRLDLGVPIDPTNYTFEFMCVRIASRSTACVAAIVYRSVTVSLKFLADLLDALNRLAAFFDPIYIVGYVNVHLERPDTTRWFEELLAVYGLDGHVKT